MGIFGEIAKGVAKELMPNTTKMAEDVYQSVSSSGKKEKKDDTGRRS